MAMAASAQSQAAVAIRLAATGRHTTAQYATTNPIRMPTPAYPAAIVWGARVSARTAARAGRAISATGSRAPTAADAASAIRQGPAGRHDSRAPSIAPKTVALAGIHGAPPRLPSQ